MLDRRGFLVSMCASLAAVPLASLASEYGGRKVVDGFTVDTLLNQEFRDLHFRTPIQSRFVSKCRFINCNCDSSLIASFPGKALGVLGCHFDIPADFKGVCVAVTYV